MDADDAQLFMVPCRPTSPLRNTNYRSSSTLIYFLNSTSLGYSLFGWRPYIMRQLPRYRGYSEAFDTSITTFTSLLEALHQPSPFQNPSTTSLQLYATSIKALQKALADPGTRYHFTTLYAVYALIQCHAWIFHKPSVSHGHSEGLQHLISVFLRQNPKDSFVLGVCHAIKVDLVC